MCLESNQESHRMKENSHVGKKIQEALTVWKTHATFTNLKCAGMQGFPFSKNVSVISGSGPWVRAINS